jgi:hypothetical protein
MKTTLVIIVILVAGFVLWKVMDHRQNRGPETDQTETQTPPDSSGTPDNPLPPDNSQTNTPLRGVLKQSSAPARGNYMLELDDSDHIIYFSGPDQYSSLLDQEVIVTYEGDLANPEITGITPQ